jgi:hypothetical protein
MFIFVSVNPKQPVKPQLHSKSLRLNSHPRKNISHTITIIGSMNGNVYFQM